MSKTIYNGDVRNLLYHATKRDPYYLEYKRLTRRVSVTRKKIRQKSLHHYLSLLNSDLDILRTTSSMMNN